MPCPSSRSPLAGSHLCWPARTKRKKKRKKRKRKRRSSPLAASHQGCCQRAGWPSSQSMKALCVHAHYDDFEFVAAGTFELWRRKLGPAFRGRVLVCTDGKAGHHFRTRDETRQIQPREQPASAPTGGYAFALFGSANGQPQTCT